MDNKTKEIFTENWTTEAGLLLSGQVNMEYEAFYFYTACYSHFSDPKVKLPGLTSFFKKQSEEEAEHAKKIIEFMNKRGYPLELKDIPAVNIRIDDPTSGILKSCKTLEERVLDNILNICSWAHTAGDDSVTEFFEWFIAEQVSSIDEFNNLWVNCCRCGDEGLGLFLFDQSLM
jgi:ferritin heavy chain